MLVNDLDAGDLIAVAVPTVLSALDHVIKPGINTLILGVHHTFDGELDIVRFKGLAVVELNALPQMESIHQAIVGNIPLLGQAGKQLRFSVDRLALHQAIVNIQGYVVIDGGLLHIQGVRILRHNDVQPLGVAVAGRWGIVVAAARRQSKQACCTDQKRNDFLHLCCLL